VAGSIETELNNNDMSLDAGLTELCKVFEAGMSALHESQVIDGD
jgi:hypothetical protein